MWFKSHAFKNTMKKKTMKKKSILKDEGKKKGAETTVEGESDYKENQYQLSRWVIYNNFCKAKHASKKSSHFQTSGEWGDFFQSKII